MPDLSVYSDTATGLWDQRALPSEHPSISTTSYLKINTPGSMSLATDGSYMIVPNHVSPRVRAYSNESNATSGGPLSSIPDPELQSREWQFGGEYAVDREAMEEDDTMPRMPHDQIGMLAGLSDSGAYPTGLGGIEY